MQCHLVDSCSSQSNFKLHKQTLVGGWCWEFLVEQPVLKESSKKKKEERIISWLSKGSCISPLIHLFSLLVLSNNPLLLSKCVSFLQEGLFWRIHRLLDPLHRPAHSALDRPRWQTSVLHGPRSREVRPCLSTTWVQAALVWWWHCGKSTTNKSLADHLNPELFLLLLWQVFGADRFPADQPTCSCGLLPQHRVPTV